MKKTKFNCVEMKRRGAEAVGKKTRNMTREQEIEFWQEQTQYLKQFRELKKRERIGNKASV